MLLKNQSGRFSLPDRNDDTCRMFGLWRDNSISMSAWIFFILVVGVLIWLSVR